jgi:hypothetical protein
MAWNGPVNGDWSKCDFTKAPFQAGVMVLTHEEVLFVIENIKPFEDQYGSDVNSIVGAYNGLTSYEKAINGDTYSVIKGYNPEINTQGINAGGIIPEPVVEEVPVEPEAPVEEEPTVEPVTEQV